VRYELIVAVAALAVLAGGCAGDPGAVAVVRVYPESNAASSRLQMSLGVKGSDVEYSSPDGGKNWYGLKAAQNDEILIIAFGTKKNVHGRWEMTIYVSSHVKFSVNVETAHNVLVEHNGQAFGGGHVVERGGYMLTVVVRAEKPV